MTGDHSSGPSAFAEARKGAYERRVERARRLQHDERLDSLRSPPARRSLAVLASSLVAATAVLAWWNLDGLARVTTYVMVLAALGVQALVGRVVRQTDDEPEVVLDERLIAARKTAALVAYQWVTLTTVVVLVLVMTFVGERRRAPASGSPLPRLPPGSRPRPEGGPRLARARSLTRPASPRPPQRSGPRGRLSRLQLYLVSATIYRDDG